MPRDAHDVAVFWSPRSRAVLRSRARRLLGRVPGSRSLVVVLELAASAATIFAARAVDSGWYAAQRRLPVPRIAARLRTVVHYVALGRRAGLSPHPLVEPEWCDPRGSRAWGPDPLARILAADGWHRRRGPHPLVDLDVWVGRYPEAARHRHGPFGHLLEHLADGTVVPVPPWWKADPVPSYAELRVHAVAALEGDPSASKPPAGEVLVVVECRDDGWENPQRALLSAVGERGAAVMLALASPRRRAALRILRLFALHPRVSSADTTAAALLSGVEEGLVVLLHEKAEGWPGWLARVVAPLGAQVSGDGADGAERPVVACGPLTLAEDGSVADAGRVAGAGGDVPAPLLLGLPSSDARRCGELIDVLGVPGAAVAGRAHSVAAALQAREAALGPQADAMAIGTWWATDLCLRMTAGGEGRCVTVTTATAWWPDGQPVDDAACRRLVAAMLPSSPAEQKSSVPTEEGLLAAAGLTVRTRVSDGAVSVRTPVYAQAQQPGDVGTPRLRWSLRIAAPAGPRATAWGDWHFANALAAALERLGQRAAVDCHEARHRTTAELDDVVVVLRGRDALERLPGQVVLLWVISHPELVDDAELAAADAVFAASVRWSRTTSERTGQVVTPLLQATDPAVFHPDADPPTHAEDVLFVGNTRGIYRPVVRHLVQSGIDVALYGRGWERFVDRRLVKGESVPNDRLAGYYRAARVVLNDHWDHMREQGFLSNRLFDAAASGARVISDEVEECAELFGGLVRTFASVKELLALVEGAREAFPDDSSRVSLARRIGREHSFDARAATLLAAADACARHRRPQGAMAQGIR